MQKIITSLLNTLSSAQLFIDKWLPQIKKLETPLKMVWNKGIAGAVLAIMFYNYTGVANTAFGEVLYALILVGTTIVSAPVVRMLVFPAAAEMAENGVKKLLEGDKVGASLIHYWLCTAISYLVTLVCVSSLL
ncbi:MAG: hypothetical protein ACPH5P_00370 [Akkermansiaceae bacterium]